MKTAIILSGNIRTWDICKSDFIEKFKHLNADLYIDTYRLRYDYHPVIKDRINDSDDVFFNELGDIYKLFDDIENTKIFNIEDNFFIDLEQYRKIFDSKFKHLNINCFGAFRKLYNLLNQEILKKYDLIIKTRMDLTYHDITDIDFDNIENKKLIIDDSNVYPNDCFLAGSYETMYAISKFMYDEFFNPKFENSAENVPHNLLFNAALQNNIELRSHKIMKSVIRKGNIENFY